MDMTMNKLRTAFAVTVITILASYPAAAAEPDYSRTTREIFKKMMFSKELARTYQEINMAINNLALVRFCKDRSKEAQGTMEFIRSALHVKSYVTEQIAYERQRDGKKAIPSIYFYEAYSMYFTALNFQISGGTNSIKATVERLGTSSEKKVEMCGR